MKELMAVSPGMTVYMLVLSAVLGAVFASFGGCVASRLVMGESFLRGRSHCCSCGHTLSAPDLIPVFSWIFLKGRCRYCGAPVSPIYPVSEAMCGAWFALSLWRYGVTIQTLEYDILIILLLILSLVDWDSGILPDSVLLIGVANFVIFSILQGAGFSGLLYGILSGLTVSIPLLVLVLIMDRLLGVESMGGGDIKLFFVVGMYFPLRQLLVIVILACVIGIVFALLTKKTVGDAENPKAFPFGPAIALAAAAALLWAQPIADWYLGLF